MREFAVSNDLIGDDAALDVVWERDGYWFFRDVIDREAVERLRAVYIEVLVDLGFVDPGSGTAVWNGANMENFPVFRIPELIRRAGWRDFIGAAPVAGFFSRILGEPGFWLPMIEQRAQPRQEEIVPFLFVHQDGFFYNGAIPCRTCWFPLDAVDATMGGLAVAAGLHRRPFLHDASKPPAYDLDLAKIPDDAWRYSEMAAGDVIVFDERTPHTGLPNYSDRFRLSLDMRVMRYSDSRPAIGPILAVSSDSITIEAGGIVTFPIDDATYIRTNESGLMLNRAEIERHYAVGDEAIVAVRDGRATFIRPPSR